MHSLPMHQALRSTPDRNGAGYGADRRRGGAVASVGCTALVEGLPRATETPSNHGDFAAEGLALRRQISALARMARETMGAIE
jgi:hypothetical protein